MINRSMPLFAHKSIYKATKPQRATANIFPDLIASNPGSEKRIDKEESSKG
jgi:hypothetical protein